MPTKYSRKRLFLSFLVVPVAAAALFLWNSDANAAKLKTLHNFCALKNCVDGEQPWSDLLLDQAGNLYGTAPGAGEYGGGAAFELVRTGSRYKIGAFYDFCKLPSCADGSGPFGSLIQDVNGNLYGITNKGGAHDGGTVYELIRPTHGKKWTLRTIHDFCSEQNCTDGYLGVGGLTYQGASAGIPYDGTSPLFGVAQGYSTTGSVAFEITGASSDSPTFQVIYTFCSILPHCDDGLGPLGTPVLDANGNLYGVTAYGPKEGLAFELSPAGGGTYSDTVLYSFCSLENCADGNMPEAPLVMDTSGNLFGATQRGGSQDSGIVYMLKPDGPTWNETVLYNFCSLSNCSDGELPNGELLIDHSGDLIGTTLVGGANQNGTVFRIHKHSEKVIYSFCSETNCADGIRPLGGVIEDPSGLLYGTTGLDGSCCGTVFRLKY